MTLSAVDELHVREVQPDGTFALEPVQASSTYRTVASTGLHPRAVRQREQTSCRRYGCVHQAQATNSSQNSRQPTPVPQRVHEKPAICGGFLKADEGTRTLDLLHGKQTL